MVCLVFRYSFVGWFVFFFAITNKSSSQLGCTDVLAKNFDSKAIENDGSCTYKKLKLKEFKSVVLSDSLNETSGLIEWENHLYTHNDDTDLNLYQLDQNGTILKKIHLKGQDFFINFLSSQLSLKS